MNLPAVLERSSALSATTPGSRRLELIGLAVSGLIGLVFVAYLLRCYFQEFWRAYRVQRRKRRARIRFFPRGPERGAVIDACERRRASAMASEVPTLFPGLDWRGLPSFIPSHERVTLVWDRGCGNDMAMPRCCIEKEAEEMIRVDTELPVYGQNNS